jgi:hypothetical protein
VTRQQNNKQLFIIFSYNTSVDKRTSSEKCCIAKEEKTLQKQIGNGAACRAVEL